MLFDEKQLFIYLTIIMYFKHYIKCNNKIIFNPTYVIIDILQSNSNILKPYTPNIYYTHFQLLVFSISNNIQQKYNNVSIKYIDRSIIIYFNNDFININNLIIEIYEIINNYINSLFNKFI